MCDYRWGSASFVAAQIIGKERMGSSADRLSTAAAEFCACRITAATAATEHFDRSWRTPVERGSSDWNAAATAELRVRSITLPASWTRHSARRGCPGRTYGRRLNFTRDWLKSRIPTTPAELHSFSKPRVTLGAHHNNQRLGISTSMPAIETAALRRCQLIARRRQLELSFDDLFRHVVADLDHAFVVRRT